MASIVNIESMGFDEIRSDIEKFLAIPGELDLSDFNESSTVRRFTSALAAIYNQVNLKINSVQQESLMHSALKPDSIKYLAQSQLAYHPKRKIAPQHPINTYFTFKAAEDEYNNANFPRYTILGSLSANDNSYPISIIDAKTFELDEGNHIVKCRLGIGAWREVTISIDPKLGHLEPYHVFHVADDQDVIDDSGTIQIALVGTETHVEPGIINNLSDIAILRESEKKSKILVTSNYYGGLDINFGDGIIFGNLLYSEKTNNEPHSLVKFTVWYFVTPGFIPNFNFIPENVSWDSNYVEDAWFDENPKGFNNEMANGINEESISQIKTLSPYVAISNNRIMTNEDFITRVRRIPQIKSCASRPRHIEPGSVGDASVNGVLPLVPTATFELTGLTYRPSSEPVETTYQPLTQMEWDLNFHTQYNFDVLLGFMRVRILPPEEDKIAFELTIVLKQNLDINARSQFEIDGLIKNIVHEYCWELGIYLDTGKIVSDILEIKEVVQCYMHTPIKNNLYATTAYIAPKHIKIKYQTKSKIENQFSR